MEATFAVRPLGDSELVEAIEENLAEALTSFGRHTQATVHASPELTWFSTGVPLARFNGVVGTRLPAKAIDQTISDTLAQFQDRGANVKSCGNSFQPSDLLSCRWNPVAGLPGLPDAILEDTTFQHQGHQVLAAVQPPPVAAETLHHLEHQV
jgi:hypothetical protein